jgi:hypothetical protein
MDRVAYARALDRLTVALLGRDPAALTAGERSHADALLLLLEARTTAADLLARMEVARERMTGMGDGVERRVGDAAGTGRAALALLDARISSHAAASAALAALPLDVDARTAARRVADVRAVWRASAPARVGRDLRPN